MSANGDRNLDKGKRKRTYGTESTETADWASADPVAIRDCITAVTRTSAAVRFGYSRDGGAYAIGLYENGESYTVWCKPSEDIDRKLQDITNSFS